MLKKAVCASIGFVLLTTPLLAFAESTPEIQAELKALLAELAALQAQIQSLSASGANSPQQSAGLPFRTGAACPVISRDLHLGVRGEDVMVLQRFLIAQQLLSADSATGYYGTLTRQAVQALQSGLGVVSSGSEVSTGWGVLGPKTRTAIAQGCALMRKEHNVSSTPAETTPASPVLFSASPISGATPLAVTFNIPAGDGEQYLVEFGDGASRKVVNVRSHCASVSTDCTNLQSIPHTYTGAGTYNAVLKKDSCGGNPQCSTPAQVLGTAAITVRGSTPPPNAATVVNPSAGETPTITVLSAPAPAPSITILSPVAGAAFVVGDAIPVSWKMSNISIGSALYLQLINSSNGNVVKSQSTAYGGGGASFGTGTACNGNFSDVVEADCAGLRSAIGKNLVFHFIQAVLYTPTNGCLGLCAPGTPPATVIATAKSPVFSLKTASFSASATSGTEPLSTTFSGSVPAPYLGGAEIDFDDGTESAPACRPGFACTYQVSHTYDSHGTYTAKLRGLGELSSSLLGTLKITVASPPAANPCSPRGNNNEGGGLVGSSC